MREPIGRNVSAFFHFVSGARDSIDKTHLPVSELGRLFLDNPEQKVASKNQVFLDHEQPLEWFDVNIKKYFGIDVYEKPFPEIGMSTYVSGNVELLAMRIDVDDVEKERAIREFLNYPAFKLINTNVGSAKDYSSLYSEFKKNVRLPAAYIEKMCDSKYFRHFYTDDEIRKVGDFWTGGPSSAG